MREGARNPLPGMSFKVKSASAQPRKEGSITSGESLPAKGAWDGSRVNPESEPLKSESKRESSLTNSGNVKANWMYNLTPRSTDLQRLPPRPCPRMGSRTSKCSKGRNASKSKGDQFRKE